MKAKFIEIYGKEALVYARILGRVNLIGEHIDYEGYSVLPMAICWDTIVAIRKRFQGIKLGFVDCDCDIGKV